VVEIIERKEGREGIIYLHVGAGDYSKKHEC
jgi:hypothetical protein